MHSYSKGWPNGRLTEAPAAWVFLLPGALLAGLRVLATPYSSSP